MRRKSNFAPSDSEEKGVGDERYRGVHSNDIVGNGVCVCVCVWCTSFCLHVFCLDWRIVNHAAHIVKSL